jgi:hypothetical protein
MTENTSLWQEFKGSIIHMFRAWNGVFRTVEKSVQLVENEVDNLDEEQKLRLEQNKQNRLELEAA